MRCMKCGVDLLVDAAFCLNCGAPVEVLHDLTEKNDPELAFVPACNEQATVSYTQQATLPCAQQTMSLFMQQPVSLYTEQPMPDSLQQPMPDPLQQPMPDPLQQSMSDSLQQSMSDPLQQQMPTLIEQSVSEQTGKKKSKKGIFIVIGAVLFVAILTVGGILAYNYYRSSTYEKAMEMLENGDYQGAYDTFGKLGDYEDSVSKQMLAQKWMDYLAAVALFEAKNYEAALSAFKKLENFKDSRDYVTGCQQNIEFLQAISDFEKGMYDTALAAFVNLSDEGFPEADNWVQKTNYAIAGELFKSGDFTEALFIYNQLAFEGYLDADVWVKKAKYAIADKKLTSGDVYGAFLDFKVLGSFEDSAERMAQCITPYPATGVLYLNPIYVGYRSAFCIDASNATFASYFKLYNGETLVAAIWVNAGETVTIEIVAGIYKIKQANGNEWFGEDILFGPPGSYRLMLFEEDNEEFLLDVNIIITLKLMVQDGNVSSRRIDTASF